MEFHRLHYYGIIKYRCEGVYSWGEEKTRLHSAERARLEVDLEIDFTEVHLDSSQFLGSEI
jgi:hypothetical protein